MEITTDKGENNLEKGNQNQGDEYEFMIPLSATTKLRPFVDRYFVKYYQRYQCSFDPNLTCNQYAFLHTNKLFMIGIAKEHAIITQNLKVTKISFDCLTKGDSLQVKGKKKKGGMKVNPNTKVCEIFTENGQKFDFLAQVNGYIIEFNENLEKDVNYMTKNPESKGFVAIINSGLDVEKMKKNLIPEDEYRGNADKILPEETKTS